MEITAFLDGGDNDDEPASNAEPRTGAGVSAVPERARDSSMKRSQLCQRPLSPQSLTWRYMGDYRHFGIALRSAVTQAAYPQFAQSGMEHSRAHGPVERLKVAFLPIFETVYGAPDEARKRALQIRNFHKPLSGRMPGGGRYHSLDADTFFFAHATFLDHLVVGVDRFVRRLSPEEKEALFQESLQLYSMWGVELPRDTPGSWVEFEEYFGRTLREESRKSIGAQLVARRLNTRTLPRPPGTRVPPRLWNAFAAVLLFLTIGGTPADLREHLQINWSAREERLYSLVCATSRMLSPLWERFAPACWRYPNIANEAFRRERIDPRARTVRRARQDGTRHDASAERKSEP
ncbi:oxygenase MpaB family protein [Nocardia sp. CA-135953]|uniref:oxygenase MpaB family protein n=1 Tax=Nocardia sp. CA-135953 TaxID=3239978 RepID=UPI003D991E12